MSKDFIRHPEADKHIIEYLYDGAKTFGEIKKHLKDHNIVYQSNKGLVKKLKSLEKRRMIDRIKEEGFHPIYQINQTYIKNVSFIGNIFTLEILKKIVEAKTVHTSDITKDSIENLVQQCGFYMLYVTIQGWWLSSSEISHKQKNDYFKAWQENIFPAPFVQSFFDTVLKNRIGETRTMSKLFNDPFSYSDEREMIFKKIERILEKSYPKEKQLYDLVSENLKTTVEDSFKKHILDKYVQKNKK